MLMDAQIDHVTGLIMLRENAQPLALYATGEVLGDISQGFPIIKLLANYCGVSARPIPLIKKDAGLYEGTVDLDFIEGAHVQALTLNSKPPPYSPWRNNPRPGDNIGVTLVNERTGKSVFYAPGLGRIDETVMVAMQNADIVLVDGTFWCDDEMITQNLGQKTASEMGHLALDGPGGMIQVLQRLPTQTRKILIHINNSNPILCHSSPERLALDAANIEVAFDGMEIMF
jgi:pyrroloquinoline quinone biosynthesis protein B